MHEKTSTDYQNQSIEFYRGGVAVNGLRLVTNPTGKGGAKRGKIRGWSKASRRRMREFMLTHDAPDGFQTYGVTYTIPGDPLSHDQAKELFTHWSRIVQKRGWCAVWRVEFQRRGQPHWHVLLCVEPNDSYQIFKTWFDSLIWLGPIDEHGNNRMQLPGASRYAVDAREYDGRGAWQRYLQDHASKSKHEQTADGFGRHWGIIGRARFRHMLPSVKEQLTEREFSRVLRVMQRMSTPRVKDDRCPFGCRLGYRPLRGTWGRSVWYSRPDTITRIVEWARA